MICLVFMVIISGDLLHDLLQVWVQVCCMICCMIWVQVCRTKTISELQVFAASRNAKTISKTKKLDRLFAFREATRISCIYQA